MSAEGKRKVALALVLGLSMLVAITSGCGKNMMGPKAPTLAGDADEMSEAEALQNYSAACHNPGRWIGPRGWVYQFLMNCTPAKILKLGDDVSSGYFNDPIMLAAIKRITTSPLFYLIMFKQGAGYVIVDTAAQIVSTAWSPERRDNPGNFPTKVTLFPLDWNTYQLFHGGLHAGWAAAGFGYILNETSPEGNTIELGTSTTPGDIYANNGDFNRFAYQFQCSLVESHQATMNCYVMYTGSQNYVSLDGRGTWMREDGQSIIFDNIHFSTGDKSGRVHLYSSPDNQLALELDFNADGSGTGSMDIKNVHGVLVHYDYEQGTNNHGWWTKNNGPKHNF